MKHIELFKLLVLIALMGCQGAKAWSYGRATFYGSGDGMNVHYGSCGFGSLPSTDITALSDTDPEYAGSCGACYEVECVEGTVVDGYGESLDRSGACRSGSVVVRVTDTCSCVYPSNAYSNKRWCCGDKRHLDLSWTAFEKIADKGKGVVNVRFRRVPCPPEHGGGGGGGASWAGVQASSSSSSSSTSGSR